MSTHRSLVGTYTLAIGVVESLQLDDIWVTDNAHYLKLTVLVDVSDYISDSVV